MEVKSFLIRFEKTLIENGFSSESARSHTLKIAKSLKDADKAKIHAMQSDEPVVRMAERYIRIMNSNQGAEDKTAEADTMTVSRNFSDSGKTTESDAVKENTLGDTEENVRTFQKSSRTNDSKENEPAETQTIKKVKKKKIKNKVPLTEEGRGRYVKWIFSTGFKVWIPTFFAGLAALIVYILIALLISALVGVLVGIAAIGCIATLAGLIYGVVKIFSVVPEGIYEMGLGLLVLGITLAASIGIYNLAIRIVPILWKSFSQFIGSKKQELRTYLNSVRTECNGQ